MIANVLTFKGFHGWTCGDAADTLTWNADEAGRPAPTVDELAAWEIEYNDAKNAEVTLANTIAAAKAEAKADAIVQYLRDHTPAECARYVQDNVVDLASAKAFLKKVAVVLSVLAKESLR